MKDGIKLNGMTLCVYGLIALLALTTTASAVLNPAAVYCARLGYEYAVEDSQAGVKSYCVLPGGVKCAAGAFLRGECAAEHSYCAREGYELKAGTGEAKCVLPDGREEYASKLVKEDADLGAFTEEKLAFPRCGNGECEAVEDHGNCPTDCPKDREAPKLKPAVTVKPEAMLPKDAEGKTDKTSVIVSVALVVLILLAAKYTPKKTSKD